MIFRIALMVVEQCKIGFPSTGYSVVFRFDPFVNVYKCLLDNILMAILMVLVLKWIFYAAGKENLFELLEEYPGTGRQEVLR